MKMQIPSIVLVSVFIAAPLIFFKFIIPVLVVFLIYALLVYYKADPSEKDSSKFIGFVSCIILISTLALGLRIYEEGLASGPYYGENFSGDFKMLVPSDSISYKSGHLISLKDVKESNAILAYKRSNEIRWVYEIDTKDPFLEIGEVVEMRIEHGFLRDRVEFFAREHSEPGWVYIWKFGGVNRFYLMLF